MKKYAKGKKIETLDEIMRSDFIIVNGKVYHKGWFMSWPLRLAQFYITRGICFSADKAADEGGDMIP